MPIICFGGLYICVVLIRWADLDSPVAIQVKNMYLFLSD